MKDEKLPDIIPVFPLSNFIIFPNTNVPLNIFEPRYIQMVDDAMKNNKIIENHWKAQINVENQCKIIENTDVSKT